MTPVALFSTPWPLFNRPSIQLGALKAFIKKELPGVDVNTHHSYLGIAKDLGYDLYRQISERTWLAEAPYAALLYPDRVKNVERFWRRRASGVPFAGDYDFYDLCRTLETSSAAVMDQANLGRSDLAGFSICFGQLTSSLYFIREIKKRVPAIKIVVGGSACAENMGQSLLNCFPEIDFVIYGEGELPLVHLIRSLTEGRDDAHATLIPGLLSRHNATQDQRIAQVTDLDELPLPEYDDYFRQLAAAGPEKQFLPKIPMEISRGCWWRKSISPDGASGCAFCNLNLQWHGYRAKSINRTIREIDGITKKHKILSVSFMDNLLPSKGQKEMFEGIKNLEKDFRLFSEIRATTPLETLKMMGASGMRDVQVGIESLSTRLLVKLNKGTTAMDNMEIMKNCESHGLPDLTGNLILNFPSSDEQDTAETAKNLEFARPFKPLKGIPFWLGYGSPVWQMPRAYGIKRVGNHPYYRHLFPPDVLSNLSLIVQGYQGGVRQQIRLWDPVKKRLKEWKEYYFRLHEAPGSGPILSYRDGRDFMIIRQRLDKRDDMTHRLKDTSRKIYLFCETQRSLSEILSRFPGFGEDKIRPFLRLMVGKRLMFKEGERYLRLAVPSKGYSLR